MSLSPNDVYQGDCIRSLSQIEPGTIDLVFADPPFNIGYDYDLYDDKRAADDYLAWSHSWMSGVYRALKPQGTFWLAIGDEYAAELKLLAQRDLGFVCRSWVIWYYTFGVNCSRGFSRSHTHLFHFVKNREKFTFNAENPAVRVPSARQLVYADGRANPKGRLPDNTWILRPQDAPYAFLPDHNTWYYARVAGTFKEREGFHGCQMPEQLLGRIIRCCSNPMELVLDPFSGSGTTLTVAKKLGRRYIGFELSGDYVRKIKLRLNNTVIGAELDGSADPVSSAPATVVRSRRKNGTTAPTLKHAARVRKNGRRNGEETAEFERGIINAYKATHDGFSVDCLLAEPELNQYFLEHCRKTGLPGHAAEWNRSLLRIRKARKLPRVVTRTRRCTLEEMDAYRFASEVALQQLDVEFSTTLDDILCDPKLAAQFDEVARRYSPGYSSFEYRWAALALRKRAKKTREAAKDCVRQLCQRTRKLTRPKPIADYDWSSSDIVPGVFLLSGRNDLPIYVGESVSLGPRIASIREIPSWQELALTSVSLVQEQTMASALKSFLISRRQPMMNWRFLAPEYETVS